MKYIELKRVGVDVVTLQDDLKAGRITGEEASQMTRELGVHLDYADVVENVAKVSPQGGMDLAQMRRHMRILDQLEAADGVLVLEDNDHVLLSKLVKEHRWGVVDKNVVTFCDDVMKAPSENPELLAVAAE
ncbi:MAG: hypothetical protein K5905_12025 [Roseibium sp.]|uniref:hypothetical protein n=1 Tax=Roseibium sp. TaxID=1936156 RepID=UPI002636B998|nr:hypothetical protein [Roseibium sp.]MCV0426194.1 hypothetical protein [Roseibium sp.]